MSEVLVKSAAFESGNGAIIKQIAEISKVVTLSLPAYSRTVKLSKLLPIKSFDESFVYVRVESPETIEIDFGGKSFLASYFEIVASQAKRLSIKYLGNTEITVSVVLGV